MDQLVELPSPSATLPPLTLKSDQGKRWLSVETHCETVLGHYRLGGTLPDACVCKQSTWKSFSAEQRAAALTRTQTAREAALRAALAAAEQALVAYHGACQAEGFTPTDKLHDRLASGTCDLGRVPADLEQSLQSMRVRLRRQNLAAQIGASVKLADYPDLFPARRRARKLIAVLGPTNSGKTYDAFQRLVTAESGVYLGPLRLLALEAFSRLNEEFGVSASLITGEERRVVEGSRVTASTIEMLDTNREVEVAVIDEVQLLADAERGWAWTQAVVGANASEVWLLGALSAEPALRALAERLGLPLEIRYKERKHPLVVGTPLAHKPAAALNKAQQGDAFIVFSRRDALNLRDDLLAKSKSVACIYGALSPEVREREARRFANGEADILVATDAIGMGLNLPIQRIIFTAVEKYDGVERALLSIALLQQIGGRAGRYGHQDEAGLVVGLTPSEHSVVARTMAAPQPPLLTKGFQIAPGLDYLEQIGAMAGETRLEALLSLFKQYPDRGDGFFYPHVPDEQMERASFLDGLKDMPLAVKHIFSMAPMSAREEEMARVWSGWARNANAQLPIRLEFLPKAPERAALADAETAVRQLAAYRWFGYRLPDLFVDYAAAEHLLAPWIAAVDNHLRSLFRQGVGGGRAGVPSWYWEKR